MGVDPSRSTVEAGVLTFALGSPDGRNPLSRALITELVETARNAAADSAIHITTGSVVRASKR